MEWVYKRPTQRGRRVCEHQRLFWGVCLQKRHSAAEFVLLLPSWSLRCRYGSPPAPYISECKAVLVFGLTGRQAPFCLTVGLPSVRFHTAAPAERHGRSSSFSNSAPATPHYLASVLSNFCSAFVCHLFLVSCCFSILLMSEQ